MPCLESAKRKVRWNEDGIPFLFIKATEFYGTGINYVEANQSLAPSRSLQASVTTQRFHV